MRTYFFGGIVAMLAVAVFVGFFLTKSAAPAEQAKGESTITPNTPALAYQPPQYPLATVSTAELTPQPGYKAYRSDFYRFQLLYPEVLTTSEHSGDKSSITLLFSEGSSSGFQIFVTPYAYPEIREERFRTDISSGIVSNKTNVTIGGVPAIKFYSTDAGLGDTVEVWFVAEGFLYEVTTYRGNEELIARVLKTWQFVRAE